MPLNSPICPSAHLLLAAVYVLGPLTLAYLLVKRPDLPFRRAVLCLAAFALTRAASELLRFWPGWWTNRPFHIGFELLSAAFGIALLLLLIWRMPALLAYPTPDNMRRANEALDASLNKLAEVEKQKIEAQFMANVSHDLRTPIAAIKGYTETLLNGGLDDPHNRRQFLKIIERNADRLASLVENILSLTTVETGLTQRLAGPLDLAAFADDVIADLAPVAKRRRVELLNRIPQGLAVHAHDQQLWQILQNLLGNAVKFSPRHGAVTIDASRSGAMVEVRVRDSGPGIGPEQLPLIFDRFHAPRQGKPLEKGTGLGLTIVRTLVEAHGGKVCAESAPGEGTTFRFTLPAASLVSCEG